MTIDIQKELRKVANKDKAKVLARFFKTGKGEYGEGDKFLGVVVPEQRRIAKDVLQSEAFVRSRFSSACPSKPWRSGEPEMRLRPKLRATLGELQKLLQSEFHEERLAALLVLVELYKKSDPSTVLGQVTRKQIFNFYLKNLSGINNWDLVDLSAPNIVGDYLFTLSKTEGPDYINNFLLKLAKSKNLWSRRVAVLATFTFIRHEQFSEILDLTKFLILEQHENQDLLHKAMGWMWREVGKRDIEVLQKFLRQYASRLPRVTLRYAIERMNESERKNFLAL